MPHRLVVFWCTGLASALNCGMAASSSRPTGYPRSGARHTQPKRHYVWSPYKPNDKRRMHGKGRYTPWPGRGPYGWKISAPPPPVPANHSFWSWLGRWTHAPSDSHLHSFGFIDARKDAVIRGSSNNPGDWYSVLMVDFRQGGRRYAFFSRNHDRLEFIYLMMVDAESPGEVCWSHLTSEQLPYMELT